jgi:hypothetical protein
MELPQPSDDGVALEDLRARLEESAPFRVDGLGSRQVLREQLLDEADVEIVELLGLHGPGLRIAAAPAAAISFTK